MYTDGSVEDIDLYHAIKLSEIQQLLERIKNIRMALGKNIPLIDKKTVNHADRMGLVAAEDIKPGDKLSTINIGFAFALPQEAVGAEFFDLVESSESIAFIKKGQPIFWGSVSGVKP